MSRRTWLVTGIVAVAAAGTAFLLTRASGTPPPLDVRFSDIEKV